MLNSIFTFYIREITRRGKALKAIDFCTEEGRTSGKQNFEKKSTQGTRR